MVYVQVQRELYLLWSMLLAASVRFHRCSRRVLSCEPYKSTEKDLEEMYRWERIYHSSAAGGYFASQNVLRDGSPKKYCEMVVTQYITKTGTRTAITRPWSGECKVNR